jgi:hypothetical protein
MPAIKRSEACRECKEQPPRVRKGKRFPLCEDCRRAATTRKWKVRRALRQLRSEVGRIVEYNEGEGWRTGYLVRIMSINAEVQPIGSIGRIPDLITCCLSDVKVPTCGSSSMPTIDDFYRKMKAARTAAKPVEPGSPVIRQIAAEYETEPAWADAAARGRARDKSITKGQAEKVDAVQELTTFTEREQSKKMNNETLIHVEKDDATFDVKMQKHRALLDQPPLMFS